MGDDEAWYKGGRAEGIYGWLHVAQKGKVEELAEATRPHL